jgi:hypothetical protein
MIIAINNQTYGIGSVYGPNNTSREFYRAISSVLSDIKNNGVQQFVIGGDWNTTWDRRPVQNNIDVFQMAGLPNPKNSELLESMCTEFDMVDPFRVLYPLRRDFTYMPFGTVRLNRSRLDFFVMSSNLIPVLSDCKIASTVSGKMFDHKQVSLLLYNVPCTASKKPSILNNSFLNDAALICAVEIAARKTHLTSLDTSVREPVAGRGTYQEIKTGEMDKIRLANNCVSDLLKKRE